MDKREDLIWTGEDTWGRTAQAGAAAGVEDEQRLCSV